MKLRRPADGGGILRKSRFARPRVGYSISPRSWIGGTPEFPEIKLRQSFAGLARQDRAKTPELTAASQRNPHYGECEEIRGNPFKTEVTKCSTKFVGLVAQNVCDADYPAMFPNIAFGTGWQVECDYAVAQHWSKSNACVENERNYSSPVLKKLETSCSG